MIPEDIFCWGQLRSTIKASLFTLEIRSNSQFIKYFHQEVHKIKIMTKNKYDLVDIEGDIACRCPFSI